MKSDVGRYAIVPEWLIDALDNGTAIRLFVVLAAKYADRETGEACPSRRRLADDLKVSVDTVDRAVADLRKAGALEVVHRKSSTGELNISNMYRIAFTRPGSRVGAAIWPHEDGDIAATMRHNPESVTQNQLPSSSAAARAREADATRCVRAYDALMGTLACTPAVVQQIDGWLEAADDREKAAAWFEEACREAAASNGRSLKYVMSILGRWARDGFKAKRGAKNERRASGSW